MEATPGSQSSVWRRDRLIDALLAVALTALVVAGVATPDPGVTYDFREPDARAVILALLLGLPLAVRRLWPVPVLLVTTTSLFGLAAGGWSTGDGAFCQMIALYTVGAWCGLRAALAGLLFTYAAMGGLALLRAPFFESPLALVSVVAVSVAWVFGRGMRRRRRARQRDVVRAAEAEAARAVAAGRAVLGGRLRFAPGLHDVVSHTLSVVAVQSAVARYQVGACGPVGAALAAVEQASRAALDDLRRMLGVLREAPPGPAAPARSLPVNHDDRTPMDHVGPSPGSPASGTADRPAVPAEAAGRMGTSGVRESLVDAAVAVALTAFAVSNAYVDDPSVNRDYPPPTAGLIVLLMASSLPLAVRRRWPFTVLAGTSGGGSGVAATGAQYNGGWSCAFLAPYTVAAWRSFPAAAAGLGLMVAWEAALAVLAPPGYDYTAGLGGLSALIPWGLGLIVRRWRQDRHHAQLRVREAERTRALAAERAAFAERVRIAGELHDVISHTLTAIAVQSAVARHQLGEHPAVTHPAGAALVAIEQASRTALDDLRRMLGALGTDAATAEEGTPDGTGGLRPSPGLAELGLLASAHRAAHGPIELTVDPAVESTPDSLRLTAYRLIQEALTNVRKHAPGAAAHVLVEADQGNVVVQIDDDGPGPSPWGTGGYGLAGMRERVALFGGTLHAGPRDDGGFRVRAVLRTSEREAAA
ncbi:hypothetical protein K1W54_06735 [Micromonospora sp. CPCC 205371]|nr:hypothetical protein [Micromonospora sp. CPCC 205371]